MRSILQDEKRCWFCGRQTGLECHHIFGGVANRRISEQYGLKVWLCHDHHTGVNGAQYNPELNRQLKMEAQIAIEMTHTHDDWMRIIRKNYV